MPIHDSSSPAADLADVILSLARWVQSSVSPEVLHLTNTEATVLRYVDRNAGTTAGQAAADTRLQRSNLSTALRSLEQKGMVRRDSDDEDARTVRLWPTEYAHENVRRLRAAWADILADHIPSDADVASLIEELSRIEHRLHR